MGTQQQQLGATEPQPCPEGYTRLFGPLCIQQTTLKKIEDIVPELPEFHFTNPSCEAALAGLKGVAEQLDKALQMPRKLMQMAKRLIEKPFDDAQRAVDSALSVLDEINSMINDVLSGPMGAIGELRNALQKMLDCPFIADLPIAKTAASLLDAMRDGLPYEDLLNSFKSQLSQAASEQINKAKEQPLNALNNLQKLYDDMLQRGGVADLIRQVDNLYKCVEAACNMAEVAGRLPKKASEFLGSINGVIDETTGKLSAAVVKAANSTQQAAIKVAEDLAVIKLAGTP